MWASCCCLGSKHSSLITLSHSHYFDWLCSKKRSKYIGELETEPDEEEEIELTGTQLSRSGRVITPVMDWWRGERLKTDVNGVTVVDHGSPAYISYVLRLMMTCAFVS